MPQSARICVPGRRGPRKSPGRGATRPRKTSEIREGGSYRCRLERRFPPRTEFLNSTGSWSIGEIVFNFVETGRLELLDRACHVGNDSQHRGAAAWSAAPLVGSTKVTSSTTGHLEQESRVDHRRVVVGAVLTRWLKVDQAVASRCGFTQWPVRGAGSNG